ncbi:MAG: hypothetical protein KDC33_02600 [Thermoleophilia bacterium]|nr:hypothetical protein [Thermoleophilia bacterium]
MNGDPLHARVRAALDARSPSDVAADDEIARADAEPDGPPVVRLRPETAYSSKPRVGGLITRAKRTLITLERQVLEDLVAQFNQALHDEYAQRRVLEGEVERLRDTVRDLRAPGPVSAPGDRPG